MRMRFHTMSETLRDVLQLPKDKRLMPVERKGEYR